MTSQSSWIDTVYAAWQDNGSAMAADIGELPVTVNQWRFRGNIPPKYWAKIIDKAGERGVHLPLEMFVQAASSESQAA